ncbi:MAG TPA: hypothetical protein DCY27_08940 [Desulfobacterales bacterium]|nr:hypothetical protein [Desulfobacterales bacterium]
MQGQREGITNTVAINHNPYLGDQAVVALDNLPSRISAVSKLAWLVKRGHPIVVVYALPGSCRAALLDQLKNELIDYEAVRLDMAAGDYERELELRLAGRLDPQPLEDGAAGSAALSAEAGSEAIPRVAVLGDGPSGAAVRGEQAGALLGRWEALLSSSPHTQLVLSIVGSGESAANTALTALPSVVLDSLTLEETDELLCGPVSGRLAFDFDAVRRIWELSGGCPELVLMCGQALFANESAGGRVRLNDVERAVPQLVELSEPVCGALWRQLTVPARMVLLAAVELRGRHGVLSTKELQGAARAGNLNLDAAQLPAVIEELVAAGAVCRLGSEMYQFCAELFRLWIVAGRRGDRQDGRAGNGSGLSHRSRSLGITWRAAAGVLLATALLVTVALLWSGRDTPATSGAGSLTTAPPTAPLTPTAAVVTLPIGRILCTARPNADSPWAIWIMRGDGSDPKRLTEERANDTSPTWAPDGRRLAFVSDRDGNREIYAMKADGSEQVNLTRHGAEDMTPAWSPDGENIAFASYRDGNWEIYVMKADGSNIRRLTRSAGADYSPTWSPDGKWIAFSSNRDGNWEIYSMGIDGTGVKRLTNDEATDTTPAWSPDGNMIAFESSRDGDMEIYLMGADGTGVRNLTNDRLSNDLSPAWGAGGLRILYHSNRDGGWDLLSVRLDGTGRTNLTLSSALEQNPVWHE